MIDIENCLPIDKMQLDEKILPVLHIDKPNESHYEVVVGSTPLYFTNVKSTYRYDERITVLRGWRRYLDDLNSLPCQAYKALLWHLFPDFLNAYSSHWASAITSGHDKDLYISRNTQGFIKIGITSDVKARILKLTTELGGQFEIMTVIKGGGKYESLFHSELMMYLSLTKQKRGKDINSECFLNVPEVNSKIDYILENLDALYQDFIG